MVSILDAQGIPLRDPKRELKVIHSATEPEVDFYAQASKMPLLLRAKGGERVPQDPELPYYILRMAYAATPAAAASVQCSFRNFGALQVSQKPRTGRN